MASFMIFLIGLVFGSFFNVIIYRVPRGESLFFPSSRCPSCGENIKGVDLLPVVGYLFLRGRCRYCLEKISWRYPLVELLSGCIFLLSFHIFGINWPAVVYLFLLGILLIAAFIDLEHHLVPNSLVFTAFFAGLAAQLFLPFKSWGSSLTGLVLGGGIFLAIYVLTRGGMGAGDVKLMAVIGFYLGWPGTIIAMFFAFLLGAISGIFLIAAGLKKRRDPLPFVPALFAGTFLTVYWGELFWHLYFNQFYQLP